MKKLWFIPFIVGFCTGALLMLFINPPMRNNSRSSDGGVDADVKLEKLPDGRYLLWIPPSNTDRRVANLDRKDDRSYFLEIINTPKPKQPSSKTIKSQSSSVEEAPKNSNE